MGHAVEHVLGPLSNGVQECSRCGEILTDYRGAAWPLGDPPPTGLTAGERFLKSDLPNGAGVGVSRALSHALAPVCLPVLEHVAAPAAGVEQRCERCHEVLLKASGSATAWAPTGEHVVATATLVMPRSRWPGPTRPCTPAPAAESGSTL